MTDAEPDLLLNSNPTHALSALSQCYLPTHKFSRSHVHA